MSSIDSESLVASKENIQPLRRGRDTSQLCAGLQAETDTEKHQALEKQRNEFEIRLRSQTKSDPDPLNHWCEYVNWIEQSFPKQPQKGNLNKVLQRCLHKFKDEERYMNDVRFVKLCIKYADLEKNTVELFGMIHGHGIGVQCAELYIAWAEKYALDGCFKKANAVYEKGLKTQAQPFELLEEAHKSFLASVALKMLSKTESNEASALDTKPEETRQPYNVLQSVAAGRKEIVPSVRVGSNVLGEPGKLKMSSIKDSKPRSNTGITIYQDGENDSAAVEPKAKLDKIPSKKTLTKENTVKAGIWSDKQKKNTPFTLPPPPTPVPFQVHVDEDSVESVNKPRSVASSVLKQHKIKKGYEDESYDTAPLFYLEPYDPSKKPMYCKEQVYAGGLEFQFEELRAIRYRRKKEEEMKKKLPSPKPIEKEIIEPLPLVKPESQVKSKSEKKKNKSEDSEKKVTESKRKTLFGKPKPIEKPVLPEEPGPVDYSMNQTIHTKEALSEMQQLWFSKPASPLLIANPPEKQIGKSILKPTKPSFNLYVDESCLDDFKKPVSKPIDDEDKENDIPEGYCGPTGKSERKTTGILTPAENIETAPVPLSDEEEEDDRDDIDGDFSAIIQCNTTGITETINFTKAFQNPRNESTPNPQKCFHNKPDMNDSVFVPEPREEKRPQFKIPTDDGPSTSRLSTFSENSYQHNLENRKTPPKSFKHLSVIAETSREYKSSSSGSSAMIEGSLLLARDPFSEEVIERFLKVVDFPNKNHVSGCYAMGDIKVGVPKVGGNLVLGDDCYEVKKMLGEGSYAKIFKIVNEENGAQMIAKYQKPSFPWEFYITREVQARIKNKDLLRLYMNVESAYFFQNASILLSRPVEYGDLLSAINKMKQGQIMCQLLAMYFTVEILTILETLHSCKIIHGDIKPDNFLLMSDNKRPRLQLIDFGRGIDMSLFPENTTFNRVVTTEGFTTIEMQTGKPWTYQIDLFGAANCGHCLLFGDYMKVTQTGGVWNISKIIPRYWARSEWKNFFVTLLNIESCFNLPDISKLKNSFNAILSDDPELDFSITKLVNILKNR